MMTLPVLHIWPGQWGLPSVDPSCLAAFLYLQSTVPGKFTVGHCTNPDLSPSGTLPFLTHNEKTVSSLASIVQYLQDANVDAKLDAFQNSQKTAWCSHIESNLGNLVSYMMYSLYDNWARLVHPALAYALPVPQRYYVPGRIRSTHRPRLEVAGLWNQGPVEPKTLTPYKIISSDDKEKLAHTFQREKVLQTARDCLDIYARLLGTSTLVYGDRITTLDFTLAAYILLLLKPPFPDRLLSDLLTESYPTLVSHAERILSRSLENPASISDSSLGHSLWSLLPPLQRQARVEKSVEDTHYDRLTWGWISLAAGSVGLYLAVMGSPLVAVVE